MRRIVAAAIVLLAVACGSEGDPGAGSGTGGGRNELPPCRGGVPLDGNYTIASAADAEALATCVLIFENDDAGSCP